MPGGNGFDDTGGIESIHDRHREIEKHHVGLEFPNPINGQLSIFGLAANHQISLWFEISAYRVTNGPRVVNHQNSRGQGASAHTILLRRQGFAIHSMLYLNS